MTQALAIAEQNGIELAQAHHRVLGEIRYPKLFQDPQPIFADLDPGQRVKAFGAYACHLMDLAEEVKKPYYIEEYSRDLVVKQLEKLLRSQSLVELVRARQVGALLRECGRAWDKMDDDHPSKISRRKSINKIFQETQSDYASGQGQRNGVIGLRMLGQALEDDGGNPFLRTQPIGKDNAVIRLSFFLRMSNLQLRTRQSLIRKECGQDLVGAWAAAHLAFQKNRSDLSPDEMIRQMTASLASAGWLALHHPGPLEKVVQKYWSQTQELAQALAFLPSVAISMVDEHLVRSGSSFLARSALAPHALGGHNDASPSRRKM